MTVELDDHVAGFDPALFRSPAGNRALDDGAGPRLQAEVLEALAR